MREGEERRGGNWHTNEEKSLYSDGVGQGRWGLGWKEAQVLRPQVTGARRRLGDNRRNLLFPPVHRIAQ